MIPEIMACLPDWKQLAQPRSGVSSGEAKDKPKP
jgi:hypothetical protein